MARKHFLKLQAQPATRVKAIEALQRNVNEANNGRSELAKTVKRCTGVSAKDYIATQQKLINVVKSGG